MRRTRLAPVTAIVVSAVLLAGCTQAPGADPAPEPAATQSTTPTAPAGYTGPALFAGDELSWLVPDAAALDSVIPGSGSYADASDHLDVISDGGGPEPDPALCGVTLYETQMHAVGARSVSWGDDNGTATGALSVLQFPNAQQVQDMFGQLREAGQQCAEFEWGGPAAFVTAADIDEEGLDVFAARITLDSVVPYSRFLAYAAIGNALVVLNAEAEDGIDADGTAELLRETAQDAQERLRAALTEHPPTDAEAPAGDAETAWSSWTITSEGIGPIRIGDSLETALAGFPDAAEGAARGEWKITGADGAVLTVSSADGSTVTAVMIGAQSLWGDDAVVDGELLPAADGVRVGDPLSAAVEAFPGGTHISMIAPGQRHYDAAGRAGAVIEFALDPTATDGDAQIVGIIVRGADHRRLPIF